MFVRYIETLYICTRKRKSCEARGKLRKENSLVKSSLVFVLIPSSVDEGIFLYLSIYFAGFKDQRKNLRDLLLKHKF